MTTMNTNEYDERLMRGTFNAAAKHAEIYANGIESQNDVSAPVENWSDFHRGEIHAARSIAADLRAAASSPVSPVRPTHPFGPCGYKYCDWPDGELRCNEPRTTPVQPESEQENQ